MLPRVMTLHKLSAGDGYTYLTRQVAAVDSTELARGGQLEAYYSEKGESPGRWYGSGLAGLAEHPGLTTGEALRVGDVVTEAHMKALFGEGRHPLADVIVQRIIDQAGGAARGKPSEKLVKDALMAASLGQPFPQYSDDPQGFQRVLTRAYKQWNTERGVDGDAVIADSDRVTIRTEVAKEVFKEKYDREPIDERELSGFLARQMRPLKQATAGFDLTFTPVKSVSALWALAPLDVAKVIEQCHDQAVADTLTWIEKEALFTRRGQRGVRQVETRGMIAAMFSHRDSRSGDPNLHTHVALSNKVQADDGTWLAVDGRLLYQCNVPASERYNSRIEALLSERLGVQFQARERADGKRPVREIVGVDEQLITVWSARRQVIEDESARLAEQFRRQHGRVPTPVEAIALAQEANLRTRQDKHDPRSYADQRQQWAGMAQATLGGQTQVESMVNAALTQPTFSNDQVDQQVFDAAAERVLEVLEQSRASWRRTHVISECERQTRLWNLSSAALEQTVNELVEAVISHQDSVALTVEDGLLEPQELRRSNGESMYRVHFSDTYTSTRIVQAEQDIIAMAGKADGLTISEQMVEVALLETAANGLQLNAGQTEMVRQLAAAPRQVELVLAPAGTGKTAALATLSRAWSDAGGTVIGLAPSAAAAAVLGEDLAAQTDTLAHFIADMPTHKVDSKTMLLVDEAGMAATTDLHQVISLAVGQGATVRLVGDDRQLSAVAAGGVLKDLDRQYGAIRLREVMRFADVMEAQATLALREGDRQALGWYVDHHRIKVGRVGSQEQQAFDAWAADVQVGRTSLMLAATKDSVRQLNEMAQAWRVAQNQLTGEGLMLPSGVRIGVGDLVVTRRNNRRIPVGDGRSWVRNGDTWRVDTITEQGGLGVVHARTGLAAYLPADYVREQVELGYASTIHSAQGRTVDTSHTVITGEEERRGLYVAATRGRQANHLYVGVSVNDEDAAILPQSVVQTTAVEVLQEVLDREAHQESAHTKLDEQTQAQFRLGRSAGRYQDAVLVGVLAITPPEVREAIKQAAEQILPGVTSEGGWDTVHALVAIGALSGLDGAAMMREVITSRELETAESVTGVLAWRAEKHLEEAGLPVWGTPAPLPWLLGIPTPLEQHPQWGPYLHQRHQLVTDDARDYRQVVAMQPHPFWARHLTSNQALITQVALWRASQQTPETTTEPMGDRTPGQMENNATSALHRRVNEHMQQRITQRKEWKKWLKHHTPQVVEDPDWVLLADQLIDSPTHNEQLRDAITASVQTQPLPDETAASALSWRLPEHLSPLTRVAGQTGESDTPIDTAALLAQIQQQRNSQRTPDGWQLATDGLGPQVGQ